MNVRMSVLIETMVLAVSLITCGCRQKPPATEQQSGVGPSAYEEPKVNQPNSHNQEARLERKGNFLLQFGGEAVFPAKLDRNIAYNLNPRIETYFVHIPSDYSSETPYGLIVFTDASDEVKETPNSWGPILDEKRYLFVAAENAGNDQYISRRLGLAVLGALEMMKNYRIDPNRVYAAGFSGGARMSGLLGFYQADIFHGTIQSCGADFYKPVRWVVATSSLDTAGQPYGLLEATTDEIASARNVRFVLITGSQDFRRGNIIDIFNGGFVSDGFQAKLFDVPGLGHEVSDPKTLSAALDFLEAP